ncbi:MAG: hypothetical protein Q9222_001544 [Ikaeria aurantiellina]
MEDELVAACLPAFRDNSLDITEQLDQAQDLVGKMSPLTGSALNEQILRVCHRCWDIVKADQLEESIRTRSSMAIPPIAVTQASAPRQASSDALAAPPPTTTPTHPPSSRPDFQLNPRASEFVNQATSVSTVPEQDNTNRIQAFDNAIANLDRRLTDLRSNIAKYNNEIRRLKNDSDTLVDAYIRLGPSRTSADGPGRLVMAQAAKLDDFRELVQVVVGKWEEEVRWLGTERASCYQKLFVPNT